jgi:hypothetical protein
VVMNMKEFEYRRKLSDRFIVNVFESKKQLVVDKNHIFSAPDMEE